MYLILIKYKCNLYFFVLALYNTFTNLTYYFYKFLEYGYQHTTQSSLDKVGYYIYFKPTDINKTS